MEIRTKDSTGWKLLRTIVIFGLAVGMSIVMDMLGISKESIIMVFLLGVLFITVATSGPVYGLVASAVSLMVFNYLYTEPRYTFAIYSTSDVMMLAVFLVTAMVSGTVTSRLQQQMTIAHHNELTARLLYEVSGGFLHVTGKRNIIINCISNIYQHTGCTAAVELTGETEVYSDPDNPPDQNGNCMQIPIQGVSKELGRIEIYGADKEPTWKQELIFKTVATQTGIALDREFIYNERENIRIAMERERLRSTLLRSVAHDLRSPLTALSGASSLLSDSFDRLTAAEQKKLARDINEEIVWLTNLVENILSMTRINESQLAINKEYEVVDDVVSEAVSHMRKLLGGRRLSVKLPDDVVTLPMDGKLVAQVIINLLDNAIKHTKENDSICVSVSSQGDQAVFTVEDTGEGIAEKVRDTLFEGFVTNDNGVSDGRRGIGLGLAICKAVIDGHGGSIYAEDVQPHGARFVFSLPMEEKDGSEL